MDIERSSRTTQRSRVMCLQSALWERFRLLRHGQLRMREPGKYKYCNRGFRQIPCNGSPAGMWDAWMLV